MAEKQPTKQEIENAKKELRNLAMRNFSENKELMDAAAAYFADHPESGFGKQDNSAMSEFKYSPAIKNGIKYIDPKTGEVVDNLVEKLLRESREEGKFYSGNVSDAKIIKECAQIAKESLDYLKIQDALDLTGSDKKVRKEFENIYVSDLNPRLPKGEYDKLSENQRKTLSEQKNLYQSIVGGYQSYLTKTKVSEALGESAKQVPKTLETLLCEPEKMN